MIMVGSAVKTRNGVVTVTTVTRAPRAFASATPSCLRRPLHRPWVHEPGGLRDEVGVLCRKSRRPRFVVLVVAEHDERGGQECGLVADISGGMPDALPDLIDNRKRRLIIRCGRTCPVSAQEPRRDNGCYEMAFAKFASLSPVRFYCFAQRLPNPPMLPGAKRRLG